MSQLDWDRYFMKIAKAVGTNTKCLSRSIGAVITKGNRLVSAGYNGPPSGVASCSNRTVEVPVTYPGGQYTSMITKAQSICPRKLMGFKSGEGLQFCPASHAEVNAIVTAARLGISVDGGTLYCDCPTPCPTCAGYIINAGIRRVVYTKELEYYTDPEAIKSVDLLKAAEVQIFILE
jgi:dCMP deaminase